ncbi:hypothetical protein H6F86_16710 [Phormidium sp. FACHB-592]|uniref:Helix-turn-helix domain-containing protein n=1 Tax=Stenomitos frigidus AS-A4 TaxID=2933935 RepID=A0ABV0KPG2_9CYAN|nr:hypothetical protein [Phormidium sp. FACHB-592]MBD2075507.1 hypothetical protein [Phormidium sp. FACHB-592]
MKPKKPKFNLPSNTELVTIQQASLRLGKGFSRRSILRRIDEGEWEEGTHWIDDRRVGSVKRMIKINLTAVMELRGIPSAYR